MKKVVLVIVALVCFFQSFSQEEKTKSKSKAKSFFGVKTGFNVIKLREHEDKSLGFGFQIGSTLTVPLGKHFAFQPELLLQTSNYSRKETDRYSNGYITQEYSSKSVYVIFPMNFKYLVSKKIDIDLGPNVGFIAKRDRDQVVTQNLDGNVQVFDFDPDSDPYQKDNNKLVLGMNLGVNYNITDAVYTGLRYTLFVTEFQTLDSTADNSMIALSFGYSFK